MRNRREIKVSFKKEHKERNYTLIWYKYCWTNTINDLHTQEILSFFSLLKLRIIEISISRFFASLLLHVRQSETELNYVGVWCFGFAIVFLILSPFFNVLLLLIAVFFVEIKIVHFFPFLSLFLEITMFFLLLLMENEKNCYL